MLLYPICTRTTPGMKKERRLKEKYRYKQIIKSFPAYFVFILAHAWADSELSMETKLEHTEPMVNLDLHLVEVLS